MILLWNSSGPISLPLGTPGCGSESAVGGYSPGLRGSAALAAPAINTNANPHAAQIFIALPLPLLCVDALDRASFYRFHGMIEEYYSCPRIPRIPGRPRPENGAGLQTPEYFESKLRATRSPTSPA